MIRCSLEERTLHFKVPARTSRGEYTTHRMIVVTLTDGEGRFGEGECAPLPDLSSDRDAYPTVGTAEALIGNVLEKCMTYEEAVSAVSERLRIFPALLFAVESALAQLFSCPLLYDTSFARSEVGIPINGLVWMGDYEQMLSRLEEKLSDGYGCVKLKIGAIRWEDEIRLLEIVRGRFAEDRLQLRVDANGAFSATDVDKRLSELAQFGLHSIEQPVRAGQWELMARLAAESPVPLALDEELIGVNTLEQKRLLLDTIRPQYVVVKPTLHGGLSGAREWIEEARSRNIGSWITSALESNIGLRSVALLCASIYGITPENAVGFPAQGLGTGLLFTDNVDNGIEIRDGRIWISR